MPCVFCFSFSVAVADHAGPLPAQYGRDADGAGAARPTQGHAAGAAPYAHPEPASGQIHQVTPLREFQARVHSEIVSILISGILRGAG